jgi:hypothetical protein
MYESYRIINFPYIEVDLTVSMRSKEGVGTWPEEFYRHSGFRQRYKIK